MVSRIGCCPDVLDLLIRFAFDFLELLIRFASEAWFSAVSFSNAVLRSDFALPILIDWKSNEGNPRSWIQNLLKVDDQ